MPELTFTYARPAAVWWYNARQLRLQAGSDSRSVLAVHTACDCSCKGSERGKAEAVTAEVRRSNYAQRLTEILGVGPHLAAYVPK